MTHSCTTRRSTDLAGRKRKLEARTNARDVDVEAFQTEDLADFVDHRANADGRPVPIDENRAMIHAFGTDELSSDDDQALDKGAAKLVQCIGNFGEGSYIRIQIEGWKARLARGDRTSTRLSSSH